MVKGKKKLTKDLPAKRIPAHKQKKLDEEKKKQAKRDIFTTEREKSKPIIVSTGDLKEK